MGEENINIEMMKSRGLTCSKLKSLGNKEKKNKQKAYKEASEYRRIGFESSSALKESIGNQQEQLSNKLAELKKKVCGLQ